MKHLLHEDSWQRYYLESDKTCKRNVLEGIWDMDIPAQYKIYFTHYKSSTPTGYMVAIPGFYIRIESK
jgi:hypothetical protein